MLPAKEATTTTMSWRSSTASTVVILVALATCGDDETSGTGAGVDATVGTSVTGYLVAFPGQPMRLCEALAESQPPQCGGAPTVIAGLDLSEINGLEEANDVEWTNAPISLLGDLADGVLTVPVGARGPMIIGRAVASPICPVKTFPPDPECTPRSVADATVVVRSADGDVVATVKTDATGRYAVRVFAGVFDVEPAAVEGSIGPAPVPSKVTVDATPVTVDVAYDTGIR